MQKTPKSDALASQSEEGIRKLIDSESDYYAHEIVVPITGNPTTPYEINAVKKYKAEFSLFADRLLALATPLIEARARKELIQDLIKQGYGKMVKDTKWKQTKGKYFNNYNEYEVQTFQPLTEDWESLKERQPK